MARSAAKGVPLTREVSRPQFLYGAPRPTLPCGPRPDGLPRIRVPGPSGESARPHVRKYAYAGRRCRSTDRDPPRADRPRRRARTWAPDSRITTVSRDAATRIWRTTP
ncbi:hypothetical protein GCM10010276_33940 [Streptomyces longisporus]|uniref:Uncharacterized protein n=1 Tax=Streptomyces longisporus TaxID=1948 RepID=A0ABN3M0Z2_STRLO